MAEQHAFLETLESNTFQQYIVEVRGHAGELTVEIKPEHLVEVLKVLKNEFGFNYLVDITAADHYQDGLRFELCYNLISMHNRQRLRVSIRLPEEDPTAPSIIHIWKAADWYEREAFDMVGIKFEGHGDLRRIFMPEDFEWYPLRKEFPQLGIPGSIPLPEKDPPKPYK